MALNEHNYINFQFLEHFRIIVYSFKYAFFRWTYLRYHSAQGQTSKDINKNFAKSSHEKHDYY